MARHQPQGHSDPRCFPWLVAMICGTLLGCDSETAATNAVAVGDETITERAVSPTLADTTAVAESTDEISVPDPSSSEPSPNEPVTAVMSIRPQRVSVGETAEVLVNIRIAEAHFIHASDDPGGPFVPVAVKMTLPEGVEFAGDWQLPTPEKGRGNSLVYYNLTRLRRSLRVVSNSTSENLTITAELQFQACTDELCWPQGRLELSAPLVIQSQSR